MAVAGPGEVVRVDGPSHDSGQALVVSELSLLLDGQLVVVADPLDALDHVGCLVVLIHGHVPATVRVLELLADLIVAHEPVFTGVGALEGGLLGSGAHLVVVRVLEVESSSVERNSEDSLLGLGAALVEVVPGVLHVQEEVLALLVRPRFKKLSYLGYL